MARQGGGGGGGGTIDATTILATGDLKTTYGTGSLAGFVRANGRTIGSATSGATERANADCQALFTYLWNIDATLTVSSGRGVSAAADWASNKTITTPDFRGRTLAGLDDMGTTAAGRLTSTYFGSTPTVLGAVGGSQSHTLSIPELPAITPTVGSYSVDLSGVHPVYPVRTWPGSGGTTVATDLSLGSNLGTSAGTLSGSLSGSAALTINMNTIGSGNAHAIIPPTMLVTVYVKL